MPFGRSKPTPAAPKPPTLEERLNNAQTQKESAVGVVRAGVSSLEAASTVLNDVQDQALAEVARLSAIASLARAHKVEADTLAANVGQHLA